jgi:hypothetical protein
MACAFVCGVAIASAATAATADKLLTGADIKNGSITERDLAPSIRAKLARTGLRGPAGPAGATGATGAPGAAGPVGPSEARVGFSASGTVTNAIGLVVGLTYPAAPHVIHANLILVNTGNAGARVLCNLSSFGSLDDAEVTLDAAGGLDTATVALSGTVDPPAGPARLAQVTCTTAASGVTYEDADIVAIRVGALG